MMDEVIKPNAQFFVSKTNGLSPENELNLSRFYLPVIGTEAFALYHFFNLKQESDVSTHSEILTWLDLGMPTFIKAREKLEALGLLKSFYNATNQTYRYELLAPLSAERFLADEILCSLLRGKIGDVAFAKLEPTPRPSISANEKEISATFQSIFALNEMNFQERPAKEPATVNPSEFDWLFLNDVLEKQGLHLKMLAQNDRNELRQLAELYGYDELSLAKVIVKSSTDPIDLKAVRKTVAAEFNSALQKMDSQRDEAPKKDEDRFARLQTQGFTQDELNFIKTTEKYAPLPFLAGIKQQKKGYVADSERYLIENLRKRSHLPDSVINVLIDYVLRQQNNPSLQNTYVNTIANDWAQKEIKLPEDAMLAISNLVSQSQNKPTRKARNTNAVRPPEPLPDWVGKEFKETEMSEEEQAKFQEQIKRLKESRGDHGRFGPSNG